MIKQFMDAVRGSLFGGKLSQSQVDGMDALLKEGAGLSLKHMAYVLATAYHETGKAMYPNRESTYYTTAARIKAVFGTDRLQGYAPSKLSKNSQLLANVVYGGEWGEKNLGNTFEGDGYKYRGGGFDHTTGRRNYERAAAVAGVDLVGDPDLIMNVDIAARVIIAGMTTGYYRGYKLSDFDNYMAMRAIVNPDRNGGLIAGYAEQFDQALVAADWGAVPDVVVDVAPQPKSPLAAIIAAILAFIKGGKK